MKRTLLPVIIAAIAISLFFHGCNLVADVDCGAEYAPRELTNSPWVFTSSTSWLPGEVYTYLENNQRYFIVNMYVDDLCTKEHTQVSYEVALMGVHSLPLDIVGTTSWNFLYEQESVMSEDAIPPHTPVHAEQEIGLYQAFGEDPGWIILRLSLSFPSTNTLDFDQDSIYFVNHVSQMDIYVDGFRPKD